MEKNINTEIRVWSVYFLTLLIAIYFHELGHCIPAWINGVVAIPTPCKEYIIGTISGDLQQKISLGGILGTMVFTLVTMLFFQLKTHKYSSAILAGALAMPGMYTFRFFIAGRGHDANEFQETQAALGFSYSGHSIDWILLGLFLAGILIWLLKEKPGFRISGRLAIGFVVSLIFVVALQTINNAIFDPIFQ